MTDTGYTLNQAYGVRYFFSDPDLAKVLKKTRRFVKDNEFIEVEQVVVNSRYDEETERSVYEAYVLFIGETN